MKLNVEIFLAGLESKMRLSEFMNAIFDVILKVRLV
jgi:hypothetical protein